MPLKSAPFFGKTDFASHKHKQYNTCTLVYKAVFKNLLDFSMSLANTSSEQLNQYSQSFSILKI